MIACIPAMLLSESANAQLSDRVNNPTTFKVGTRPVQGNLGVSVGVGRKDFEGWFDMGGDDTATSRKFDNLPLITFKYYNADDFVITLGLKADSYRKTFKGDVNPEFNANRISSKYTKTVESEYMLVPGFEKHFITSNILDVYVAGRLPLGVVTDINIKNEDYENENYTYNEHKRRSFVVGGDLSLGVQMFVADLPFALGVEGGLAGYGYLKNKTKHTESYSRNGISDSNEFYTVEGDDTKYSSLRSRTFELGSTYRFSVAYFFSK